ncbi:uncharacterized protein TRIADDRAFT_29716 [Trichoplax adhaerens]|uniref:Enoyl reductase (ER) domain-containing protein n=1 Tax=Trichoplax adhaerens TaxID=10228 RepID=B3S5X9_TRIAD|nr:hypothetical protein TRIADDRAFT_29716 [Trichoplax adhaerens]EDV21889.1 hypothetical protein TRIADDRAFT_29716 [Trichoplax adhaerens]|eukprot:XP_002115526.1 hypothetical protein TRIADDRAFT_29716 [Trichoplax adhaerens]
MKAAQVVEAGAPLQLQEVPLPKATHDEVVIKVISVGVCHSDLHLWDGGYDLGGHYPVTPGHEIVGSVHQMGDEVVDFAVGDNVLVFPWIGCGQCPICQAGDDNVCDKPRSIGIFCNGGYAEYVIIPSYKYLAKISGVDFHAATSLACSGLTAYNAIKKANVRSPEYLVIIGTGGLGLMGIQLAKATTQAKIICVDIDDQKLNIAKNLGADFIVNSSDGNAVQKIYSICPKGVDSVVDFVNASPTAKIGLSILKKRGNLVLVGLFGGSIEISLVTIPLKTLIIQGAYTGTYREMVELLQLAKEGIINPIISKQYSLQEANTALNDLKQRKIVGRAVIIP